MSQEDKYIVCYVQGQAMDKGVDKYEVFMERSSEENFNEAKERYDELKEDRNIYTCNLCKIIESTDY